jgi:thiamine biosynthesis lipoprotein
MTSMATGAAARARRAEPLMGTVFSFDVRVETGDEAWALTVIDDAIAWLRWVDATFSTYRADSEISRLGRGELRIADCHNDVREVLDRCAQLATATGGYFSATATGVLDPSALVKGWSVGRVAGRLRCAGLSRFAVNGGGDVALGSAPEPGGAWQVGIADPHRPGVLAAVVRGNEVAVATSGTAERGTHVVDPLTGRPATALAAVTVVGPDIADADAYATAALAMGHRALAWVEELPGYEALAIDRAGARSTTSGFRAYLTPWSPLAAYSTSCSALPISQRVGGHSPTNSARRSAFSRSF